MIKVPIEVDSGTARSGMAVRAGTTLTERSTVIDRMPSTVETEKPWGRFEQYSHNLLSTVKIIKVEPGGTPSLQYHHRRDELWVILDAGTRVELGDETFYPEPEEKLFIPRGTVHRLSCVGESAIRILEISFGEFDEQAIIRLEDVDGREQS